MAKKSQYEKKLEVIRKYDGVSFKATKRLKAWQKSVITKKFKKLAPFVSTKSKSGDYKYSFLKGKQAITASKKVNFAQGTFVQIPRRVKGKVTIKKKSEEIAYVDYKNGKTGKARRRDILVKVDAKKMVKEPEKYLDSLYKKYGIAKKDILAVHFLFNGFQNRYRYSAGFFIKYIETDEGFKSLKRKKKLNDIITGIKIVTVNRKKKCAKK